MKKVLAAIVSSLAIVALCVCFAACSTDVTGTWKFYKATGTAGGLEVNYEVGTEVTEGVKITEDFVVLTINGDNTFEMKMAMAGDEPYTGEWKEENGKYYLTVEGESVEMTLSGNTLSFEQEGMKLELKK